MSDPVRAFMLRAEQNERDINEGRITYEEYLNRQTAAFGQFVIGEFVQHILHEVFDPILKAAAEHVTKKTLPPPHPAVRRSRRRRRR